MSEWYNGLLEEVQENKKEENIAEEEEKEDLLEENKRLKKLLNAYKEKTEQYQLNIGISLRILFL